jgi:hypothetical protein
MDRNGACFDHIEKVAGIALLDDDLTTGDLSRFKSLEQCLNVGWWDEFK